MRCGNYLNSSVGNQEKREVAPSKGYAYAAGPKELDLGCASGQPRASFGQ